MKKWFVKWKRWFLLTCSIVLQHPQQANLLPDIWRQSSFLFQRKVFFQNRRHNHQVEDSWRVRKYRLVWFRMRAIQWHVGLLLEAKWRRFYIQPWMPHQLYQEQSIEKQGRIELFFPLAKSPWNQLLLSSYMELLSQVNWKWLFFSKEGFLQSKNLAKIKFCKTIWRKK